MLEEDQWPWKQGQNDAIAERGCEPGRVDHL